MYMYTHSGKYFKFYVVISKSNIFNRELVCKFNVTEYKIKL